MLYYAKTSFAIDGHSYNSGEIVPEEVIKSTGAQFAHLVRKETDPVSVPVQEELTTASVATTVEESEEDELPSPTLVSDKKDDVTTPPVAPIATGTSTKNAPAKEEGKKTTK